MDRRVAAVGDLERRIGHSSGPQAAGTGPDARQRRGRGQEGRDNEVLEFIGDRVLGLLAAEALAERFPKAKEGELAPRLNALVSRETCARVAKSAELGPALRLSASSSKIGGRETDSILAGAAEALMAALYRDGGLETARRVFLDLWAPSSTGPARASRAIPRRRCRNGRKPGQAAADLRRQGPHRARPRAGVHGAGDRRGIDPVFATGRSRQEAEKAAAKALLEREGAG
jgi:ribonuclease-3